MSEPDFFVGYLPAAPPGLARFLRRAVLAVLVLSLGIAGLWAATQRSWQPGVFEFGVEREFTGTYLHTPVPQLRVALPGKDAGHSRWLLVAPGKHGGDPAWAGLDGLEVQLAGSLAYRPEGTLVEVRAGSLHSVDTEPAPSSAPLEFGHVRLQGEIVDSKCWLGVMNPGNLRTHRACASLCVRGGIPPLLVVRTAASPAQQVLLVGPAGETVNQAVLPWIALPVELEGELSRVDDLWILRTDPSAIRAFNP